MSAPFTLDPNFLQSSAHALFGFKEMSVSSGMSIFLHLLRYHVEMPVSKIRLEALSRTIRQNAGRISYWPGPRCLLGPLYIHAVWWLAVITGSCMEIIAQCARRNQMLMFQRNTFQLWRRVLMSHLSCFLSCYITFKQCHTRGCAISWHWSVAVIGTRL